MFRVCFALLGLVATQTSAFVVPATNIIRAPKASTTQLAAVRTQCRRVLSPLFRSEQALCPPLCKCADLPFDAWSRVAARRRKGVVVVLQ
jgi:hypothetical protein